MDAMTAQAPGTQRGKVLILAFCLLVVVLGFGIVVPILPFYMERLGAGGSELGLLVACYAVMRLIFGPIWGTLSDRAGRKPILMIGIFGYGITMVLFGLATQLWMMFVIRSLAGILSSATTPTTLAYIGDTTTEKERSGGMGLLGAATGLGTILGPGLGGLLGGQSLAMPFFLAGGLSFLALLLVAVFLPESRPAAAPSAKSAPAAGAPGLTVRSLRRAIAGPVGPLFGLTFLVSAASNTFFGLFALYGAARYGYGPEQVGVFLMVVGLVSAATQGLLTGPLTRHWGEVRVIRVSLLATAAGFVAMVLAASTAGVLAAAGLSALAAALLFPSVTSLISQRSTLDQGLTMGINNSFDSLGRIAGPSSGGVLFDQNPAIPYLAAAGVVLVGFVLSLGRLGERRAVAPWARDGS